MEDQQLIEMQKNSQETLEDHQHVSSMETDADQDQGETRYAIYFTLPSDNPIYQLASVWLGYDVRLGREIENYEKKMFHLDLVELGSSVTEPQRYGFHATLKAPFRLHPDKNIEDLKKSLNDYSKNTKAFICKPLKIKKISNFFAFVPTKKSKKLQQLANDCVQEFDEYRAPMTAVERSGRKPENLSPTQLEYLDQWGYPYIMDEFKFHMTLSNRIEDEEQSAFVKQNLKRLFRSFLGEELLVDSIYLFTQKNRNERFVLLDEYKLRG